VVPHIKAFEYRRSARRLNLSGRTVESFSGEVDVAFSVVNLATGQLVSEAEFTEKLPDIPPRLASGQSVGAGMTSAYLEKSANYFTERFMRSTFPVAVLKLDGSSAVLSQGGSLVRSGATYEAVMLGEAITDPQTGETLGRTEQPIGTINITRVDDRLSYGVFSGSRPSGFRPGLIELRGEVAPAELTPPQAPATPARAVNPSTPASSSAKRRTTVREDAWPSVDAPRRKEKADDFESAG
jgi:hypothetical protein